MCTNWPLFCRCWPWPCLSLLCVFTCWFSTRFFLCLFLSVTFFFLCFFSFCDFFFLTSDIWLFLSVTFPFLLHVYLWLFLSLTSSFSFVSLFYLSFWKDLPSSLSPISFKFLKVTKLSFDWGNSAKRQNKGLEAPEHGGRLPAGNRAKSLRGHQRKTFLEMISLRIQTGYPWIIWRSEIFVPCSQPDLLVFQFERNNFQIGFLVGHFKAGIRFSEVV